MAPSSRCSRGGSSASSSRVRTPTSGPRTTWWRRSAAGSRRTLPRHDRQRHGQAPRLGRAAGRRGGTGIDHHRPRVRRDLPPPVRGRSARVTEDENTTQADDATRAAEAARAEQAAERERSEARGAELRSELAATDARRAEEQTAKAHKAVEEATRREEKLTRKEQEAHAKAEAAERDADRERAEADEAESRRRQTTGQASGRPQSSVSGSSVAGPGIGSGTDPNAAASAAGGGASRPAAFAAGGGVAGSDRPEVLIGAAFAGAFVVARVLKRLVG